MAPEFLYARITELTGWDEEKILDQRAYYIDYLLEYAVVKAEVQDEAEQRANRIQEHHGN